MSRSVGGDKAGILEICMPSVRHREREMGTDEAWKRRKRSEELTSRVGWKWDRVVTGETTLAERDIWARQPGDDMVEGVVSMPQRFWEE